MTDFNSINQKRLVKISKYLSKYLRHEPEKIGLKIDASGWVETEQLLLSANQHKFYLTKSELINVVEHNDKKRFAFNDNLTKIRANQGHSVSINLDLVPEKPPSLLYHGTSKDFLKSILAEGLQKMSRHHVHLSPDINTAKIVAKRRKNPVILTINSELMYEEGYQFFCTANKVWLVHSVPTKYLSY